MKAYGLMPRDDFVAFRREAFDLVGCFNELFYVGEYEILRRLEERTTDGVVALPFTCTHLKQKPSFKDEVKGYAIGLKRYFLEYSKIYVFSFKALPLTYKLRPFYYLLFPITIVLALILFPTPFSLLFLTLYIPLGPAVNLIFAKLKIFPANVPTTSKLILHQKVAKAPFTHLIIHHFTHNIPKGISFAYGAIILHVLKLLRALSRRK
jgi:hypothetical protein